MALERQHTAHLLVMGSGNGGENPENQSRVELVFLTHMISILPTAMDPFLSSWLDGWPLFTAGGGDAESVSWRLALSQSSLPTDFLQGL